jgi:hypothetical protein
MNVATSWRLIRFNCAIVSCEVEMRSFGVARGDYVKVDDPYALQNLGGTIGSSEAATTSRSDFWYRILLFSLTVAEERSARSR